MQLPTSLVVRGVTLKGRALKHKTTWAIRLRDGDVHSYDMPSTGKPPFTPQL